MVPCYGSCSGWHEADLVEDNRKLRERINKIVNSNRKKDKKIKKHLAEVAEQINKIYRLVE